MSSIEPLPLWMIIVGSSVYCRIYGISTVGFLLWAFYCGISIVGFLYFICLLQGLQKYYCVISTMVSAGFMWGLPPCHCLPYCEMQTNAMQNIIESVWHKPPVSKWVKFPPLKMRLDQWTTKREKWHNSIRAGAGVTTLLPAGIPTQLMLLFCSDHSCW